MTSRIDHHYQPTLWDALWACAHPRKLTLLASSFGVKVSPHSNVGIRFWFGFTQRSFICPCHLTIVLVRSLCSRCNLLKVISLYFTCNLMWYICVIPCPIKRKVMSLSHVMFLLFICRCCNLSLGLATKARGLQGCRPRGRPNSHITYSQECKECEGVNPHTPKWTPMLWVGVPNGLLNFQSAIVGDETHCFEEFFISLKCYWSVDV